jgi:16S rRNA G966 N2-methylase RsmD
MSHRRNREASRVASGRSGGRRFDHEYGVTTHAVLFLTDLDPEAVGDAGAHATHYEAVPVSEFHQLLAVLPPGTIERSTFVDVGAGMGRAMILAAGYPFRQICGVEISPGLYEVARENLAIAKSRALRCRDVRLYRDDARMWRYPPGDLVVFLFNPFDDSALAQTLDAISRRDHAGETWLVYHTPVHRETVEAIARYHTFARLASGDVYKEFVKQA